MCVRVCVCACRKHDTLACVSSPCVPPHVVCLCTCVSASACCLSTHQRGRGNGGMLMCALHPSPQTPHPQRTSTTTQPQPHRSSAVSSSACRPQHTLGASVGLTALLQVAASFLVPVSRPFPPPVAIPGHSLGLALHRQGPQLCYHAGLVSTTNLPRGQRVCACDCPLHLGRTSRISWRYSQTYTHTCMYIFVHPPPHTYMYINTHTHTRARSLLPNSSTSAESSCAPLHAGGVSGLSTAGCHLCCGLAQLYVQYPRAAIWHQQCDHKARQMVCISL